MYSETDVLFLYNICLVVKTLLMKSFIDLLLLQLINFFRFQNFIYLLYGSYTDFDRKHTACNFFLLNEMLPKV